MRSALYYPHTHIRSEALLKTALMLWDRLYVIAPWEDFTPSYDSPEAARSFELIGKCHVPTADEKKQAHDLVEDFTSRKLPKAFYYSSAQDPEDIYEAYPQKLLPETWKILREADLAGTAGAELDPPMARPTGLSLMSLLADCCAGDVLARITDESAAYASISGLLTEPTSTPVDTGEIRQSLLALALNVADANKIPVSKWIQFREREDGAADGHYVRDLRHRFIKHMEDQAIKMTSAKSEVERKEINAQVQEDMRDDYKALHEALKLEAWQVLSTKEILVSTLSGIAALGAIALNTVTPLPDAITWTGAAASVGGFLASKSKFVTARRKVLRDHPLSYLYEAHGGLRL